MPFQSHRRFLRFLALDALVLVGIMSAFAAANHARILKSPSLSENILATPAALSPSRENPVSAAPALEVATAGVPLRLERLLAKSVTVARHEVEAGENYWYIASDYEVSVPTLVGSNPDLPYKAQTGMIVNVPSKSGVLHTVQPGETIRSIAALYKMEERVITAENSVRWWGGLKNGDVLFLPDAKPIYMTQEWKKYFSRRGIFFNPLSKWAHLNSTFGLRADPITGEERAHRGLDLRARSGVPVYACADGRIIFTGPSGGYGNLIKIKHKDGYVTYYGHLSKILVRNGKKVRRGTLIGKVGATGHVTGPHLHFEIRKDGKALDPMVFI